MWKFNSKKTAQTVLSASPYKRFIAQEHFVELIHVEQKRTERSSRPFILMLLETARLLESKSQPDPQKIADALLRVTRATDIKGWYRDGAVLGVIFTEVAPGKSGLVIAAISAKMSKAFAEAFAPEVVNEDSFSFQVYPDNWLWKDPDNPGPSSENRDLVRDQSSNGPLAVKRSIDVLGSLAALAILFPAFAVIVIALKATSKGPAIFRQQRMGQFGRPFTFLKFRSMAVENDPAIHEAFVSNYITGSSDAAPQSCYKIQDDPRVTSIGRFLRKTSLDELPQFLNVLMGDMSLVGPRPPIGYEVERYQAWHRQRLLAVKPGITGPWQVHGRSKVNFDEMVRMDLRYAQNWSVWLDLKILLQTPRAVIGGGGAH